MIKSKERVLNHLYNRTIYEEKVRKKAMEVKRRLDNFMENELNRPSMPNEFEGIVNYTEITVCPPHRTFNLDEFIKEEPEIYQQLCETGFKEVPIWTFYEYLRAYHVIEITVGFLITMGVYVWLK